MQTREGGLGSKNLTGRFGFSRLSTLLSPWPLPRRRCRPISPSYNEVGAPQTPRPICAAPIRAGACVLSSVALFFYNILSMSILFMLKSNIIS